MTLHHIHQLVPHVYETKTTPTRCFTNYDASALCRRSSRRVHSWEGGEGEERPSSK